MKFLFLIFLVIPVVEIYFLIKVGSVFGAGITALLVVATALLGAALVRAQGFSTLARVQQQMSVGEMPAMEIMEGLFLLVAGALLLTPGFVTDGIGFLFLTPVVRRWLIRRMLSSGALRGAHIGGFTGNHPGNSQRAGPTAGPSSGRVIDAEYRDIDD